MLIENAADPLGYRKEKHVVAIGIRPIRHRHANAMAGNKAAQAKQGQRRHSSQNSETVKPGVPHDSRTTTSQTWPCSQDERRLQLSLIFKTTLAECCQN